MLVREETTAISGSVGAIVVVVDVVVVCFAMQIL